MERREDIRKGILEGETIGLGNPLPSGSLCDVGIL